MPVLYEQLGIPGRVLSSLFFLCLALGGISSLVAMIELPVHTLEEMRGTLIFVITFERNKQQIFLLLFFYFRRRGGGGGVGGGQKNYYFLKLF